MEMGQGGSLVLARFCLHVYALKMEVVAHCPLWEEGAHEARSLLKNGLCLTQDIWILLPGT